MLSVERRDEAQPHGPPAAIDHDVVAEVLVQDVGHRVRVGDDGDDRALVSRRQADRAAATDFARSASLPGMALWNVKRPDSMKARRGAEDRRVPRLVQIQAARVIAGRTRNGSTRTSANAASPSASRPSRPFGSWASGSSRSTSSE